MVCVFFFFFLRLSTPKRESSHLCLYSHPYQQRAAQHLWHHLHSRFFFFSLLLITFSFAGCWDKYVKMVISWEYTRRVCCIIVRIIRTRPKGENAHQLLNVVDRELIGPLLFVVAQEDGAFVFFLFFSIANHWSNVGGSSFSCLFYFEEIHAPALELNNEWSQNIKLKFKKQKQTKVKTLRESKRISRITKKKKMHSRA